MLKNDRWIIAPDKSGKPFLKYRPDWHEYFLLIARVVATRSTCISFPVGSVIVRDKQILATGYNGVPSGEVHCIDQGFCYEGVSDCASSKSLPSRAIHAEANAIASAARLGICLNKSAIYITKQPCLSCLKLILAAGISSIYCEQVDSLKISETFLGNQKLLMTDNQVSIHYVNLSDELLKSNHLKLDELE